MSLRSSSVQLILSVASLVAGEHTASAQSFQFAPAQIPQGNPNNNSDTENVDFGDIDDDGDFDAVFADGGDSGNDQSRIWVNQGHAQGGTVGTFLDVTATQAPAVLSQSRDIEFVDFDNDADLDLYIANECTFTNQSARWWTNMGGLQAGTAGFYTDETSTRWVGLGGPGSSIAPSQVLMSGGFIDFSGDGDFADVDDDGDLDLVHSSHGNVYNGSIPTRIFLNDGSGYFSEFNPSGFQLSGQNIANGDPGLWCAGVQTANTTNSAGTFCDIASNGADIELADIDGDLDIDLLNGSISNAPRMFRNRLHEDGGILTFVDVTGAVFAAGYATGNGHYAQEFGDFDNDLDVDILGVNWLSNIQFFDCTLTNDGSGNFGSLATIPSSQFDEEEGDFIDYDNDGDLDIIVANFSGAEHLYANSGAGMYTFVSSGLPFDNSTSRDADMCDVDEDGDYDVFVANSQNAPNTFLKNITQVPDTHAPLLANLEQAPSRASGPAPTVVRVHVYDNAAYYTNWYDTAVLEVDVDSCPPQSLTIPMRSSMGQVFRGEIPGALVGTITYRVVANDRYSNVGVSPSLSFVATGAEPGSPYCAGDGIDSVVTTACPCGNFGDPGHGCANSNASLGGAHLCAEGTVSPNTLVFTCSGIPNNNLATFLRGTANDPGGSVFGDGVKCLSGTVLRFAQQLAGQGGNPANSVAATASTVASGNTRYYQVHYRNPSAGHCPPELFNVSNGYAVGW